MKTIVAVAVAASVALVNIGCGGAPEEHTKDTHTDDASSKVEMEAGADVEVPDTNYEADLAPCPAVCGCPGSCGVNAITGTLGGAGGSYGHVER